MSLTIRFSLGAANTGLVIGDLTITARNDADVAMDQTGATLIEMTIPGRYTLVLPVPTDGGHVRVQETADAAVWWEGVVLAPSETAALASDVTAAQAAILAGMQAPLFAALEAYDVSHSSSHVAGTTLSVSGLVGIASTQGPRTPLLVSDLFDEVRSNLRNSNSFTNATMTPLYNRALSECWHLMTQVNAEVAFGTGSVVADGVATDYALPQDFRAFVPNHVVPRSPTTGTTEYTWGEPMVQVGLLDKRMGGSQTTNGTPKHFAVFFSGNTQYVRFNTLPPAGEIYDFQYYQECPKVLTANVDRTFTPWLGLLDTLLARILEEFCAEGLEFITAKRDMWIAKTAADIVMLLGLRHLAEYEHKPSMWRNLPQ